MHGSGSVLIIVAMVALFVILVQRKLRVPGESSPRASPETSALGSEVKALKERLHVLERITVDKENSLAREIEALTDHDSDAARASESEQRSGPKIGR